MLLGSVAITELGRRSCLLSTRAADRGCWHCSQQDWPWQPGSLVAGLGGFLAGLSRMALRGIQASTISKSHDALQWKDE